MPVAFPHDEVASFHGQAVTPTQVAHAPASPPAHNRTAATTTHAHDGTLHLDALSMKKEGRLLARLDQCRGDAPPETSLPKRRTSGSPAQPSPPRALAPCRDGTVGVDTQPQPLGRRRSGHTAPHSVPWPGVSVRCTHTSPAVPKSHKRRNSPGGGLRSCTLNTTACRSESGCCEGKCTSAVLARAHVACMRIGGPYRTHSMEA